MVSEKSYAITQYYVEPKIMAEINKFLLGGSFREKIELFVSNEYNYIHDPLESLQIPTTDLVARTVNLNPNVINKLEKIAKDSGENVSQNMVFRDMLRQLLIKLKRDAIIQLEQEIKEREEKMHQRKLQIERPHKTDPKDGVE
ncbi:hypothetical protein P5815_30410 [Bacillus cereus]|uniref:hypothetical protein n=1 Tax=Bacillus cereus TaxID=1396 RepID=UPI00032DD5F1|nr:hypothetical protein [Bacillus cereus]EOO22154.1 hypothetical protein ICC_06559 [Bacillus cereus BAG1X1-1]EOO42476.1 hypothetical protein ICI_06524 [Bacillus cereus BAG1X2-1]EOO43770.1 hypothetical protein ICK_06671 [Bacillus cereus BAG1X2-2]EOP00474.1 hypothetical protein ICO_06176 [Bacillus cereus BAG2O-1]MDF9524813.1 hypothetical protein [Bacillus cereus]